MSNLVHWSRVENPVRAPMVRAACGTPVVLRFLTPDPAKVTCPTCQPLAAEAQTSSHQAPARPSAPTFLRRPNADRVAPATLPTAFERRPGPRAPTASPRSETPLPSTPTSSPLQPSPPARPMTSTPEVLPGSSAPTSPPAAAPTMDLDALFTILGVTPNHLQDEAWGLLTEDNEILAPDDQDLLRRCERMSQAFDASRLVLLICSIVARAVERSSPEADEEEEEEEEGDEEEKNNEGALASSTADPEPLPPSLEPVPVPSSPAKEGKGQKKPKTPPISAGSTPGA